jgi:hypothetical protein
MLHKIMFSKVVLLEAVQQKVFFSNQSENVQLSSNLFAFRTNHEPPQKLFRITSTLHTSARYTYIACAVSLRNEAMYVVLCCETAGFTRVLQNESVKRIYLNECILYARHSFYVYVHVGMCNQPQR